MSANTYLPGTIAIPSSLLIVVMTNAFPMVVTVSVQTAKASDTYIVGQLVRLTVPYNYGMFQADNLTAQIIAVNGLTLTLDIDSRGFDAFVIPPSGEQPASLAPAGSRNLQLDNTTTQVPFQSLNNVGN
jgi:hypothetical protein